MLFAGRKGLKIVDMNCKKAIRYHCMDCSNWSPKEVDECSHVDCSLYPYRNSQKPADTRERRKAVRRYCLACTNRQIFEVRLYPSKTCSLYPYRLAKLDRSVEIKGSPQKDVENDSERKV